MYYDLGKLEAKWFYFFQIPAERGVDEIYADVTGALNKM